MKIENYQETQTIMREAADLQKRLDQARNRKIRIFIGGEDMSYLLDTNVKSIIVSRVEARYHAALRKLRDLGVEL